MSQPVGLLERLGMHRRELRAWAMCDGADSAFMTTVIAAIFFASKAAAGLDSAVGLSRYSWASTLAVLAAAITTPKLGAMADYSAMKKKMRGPLSALDRKT